MAAKSYVAEPISVPNITPLIDVLLVLLIMMILTIPAMTHKVSVDMPTTTAPDGPKNVEHRLVIAASGALSLDGAVISEAALPDRLAAIVAEPTSSLSIDTDAAAPYATFDRVLAKIKRGGVTRLGFVGNDRFAKAF